MKDKINALLSLVGCLSVNVGDGEPHAALPDLLSFAVSATTQVGQELDFGLLMNSPDVSLANDLFAARCGLTGGLEVVWRVQMKSGEAFVFAGTMIDPVKPNVFTGVCYTASEATFMDVFVEVCVDRAKEAVTKAIALDLGELSNIHQAVTTGGTDIRREHLDKRIKDAVLFK